MLIFNHVNINLFNYLKWFGHMRGGVVIAHRGHKGEQTHYHSHV